jgi:hypothetical protein
MAITLTLMEPSTLKVWTNYIIHHSGSEVEGMENRTLGLNIKCVLEKAKGQFQK